MPNGFHTVAEVVKNAATLDTTTGREKTAYDARDMPSNVKLLWIVDSYTFYTKTKTANARKNHCLPLGQSLLKNIL